MSLVKLTDDLFEKFTLITNPRRTYVSSSAGVTGSVSLYARASVVLKEIEALGTSLSSSFEESEIVEVTTSLQEAISASLSAGLGGSEATLAEKYLSVANGLASSALNDKTLGVTRFEPPTSFGKDTLKKSAVVNNLMPYYRARYPQSHLAFSNYHSLNFFTASSVPGSSALIYPNTADSAGNRPYSPSGSFGIDFYINPRYTTREAGLDFTAGTILHLSSTFAVSLVTGSAKDASSKPTSFRLMLQLSHSADISPSDIGLSAANNSRTYPSDLAFLSSDNSLTLNHWHHVSIQWGTSTANSGTGSFFIDGVQKGKFNVPSASITTDRNNDAIFVGNFYDGANDINTGTGIREFFNASAATTEGVTQSSTGSVDPGAFSFSHPLNAEIHDLKLFNSQRSLVQIASSSMQGPDDLEDLLFYVPPFFVKESRSRSVPVTPFVATTKETYDAFNVDYSFGVGGHLINLENFTRELVKGEYPRLYQLTASVQPAASTAESGLSANDYLMATGSIRKRNLTVLPCDNGMFTPNFELLLTGTFRTIPRSGSSSSKFVTDLGAYDSQLITLRNLTLTSSLRDAASGSFDSEVEGASPEDLSASPGDVLSIYARTRDPDTNQIVLFDISDVLFGQRVRPGTIVITDSDLTGSDTYVSMTLRDNGAGSLYRADALTKHATWNTVGNAFYNEGILLIKAPTIPRFGKDQFTLSFQGEQQIHVMRINVPAPATKINSSSNPDFLPLSATLNANDTNSEFVYITGLVFHDDNLNVILRTNLAQPIVKRKGDKLLLRPRIDF